MLADPTAFEEPLLEGAVCAVLGAGGAVVSLSQTGSVHREDASAQPSTLGSETLAG